MNKWVFRAAHVLARRGLYKEAGDLREAAHRWYEYGYPGEAHVRGILDALCYDEACISEATRDVLVEMIRMGGPDGFARQYAELFGEPCPDMEDVLAECHESFEREKTPLVEAECLECGQPLRIPIEILLADNGLCLCHRCMLTQFNLLWGRLIGMLGNEGTLPR